MAEKIDLYNQDKSEVVGWIEVDTDLNISWSMEDEDPHYPNIKKSIHKHKTDRIEPDGRRYSEQLENDDGTTYHADAVRDPEPGHVLQSIMREGVGINDDLIAQPKPGEIIHSE